MLAPMMAAVRRFGVSAVRTALAAGAIMFFQPPNRLTAQDSQFGIKGLGTPGRWESVRARSTGGAFAPFDPFSPLTDASLADARRMSASITGGTSWRTLEPTGAAQASSLRATRFPALVIAGPVTRRIVVGGGFA